MMKRVTIPLDQELLRQAAEILGTSDPSDTVNRALAEAIEIVKARRLADEGGAPPTH